MRGAFRSGPRAGVTYPGPSLHRRQILQALAIAPFASLVGGRLAFGNGVPFSREAVIEEARRRAARPFEPLPRPHADIVSRLDYEAVWQIQNRFGERLWSGENRGFSVEPLFRNQINPDEVLVHEVHDGMADRLPLQPVPLDFEADVKTTPLAPDLVARLATITAPELGFGGFRLYTPYNRDRDVAAFQGASYFRAVGGSMQYGISARGIAIDTTKFGSEEFPQFRELWLERPGKDDTHLVLHALLDGRSVTGAYRFRIEPGSSTVMDVEATLFFRRAVDGLGLAPLTSMYHHGENFRGHAYDFRAEVHDSDGLAMLSGNGEWIWRPLTNPASARVSSFIDSNPRGFGLLQRDRDFDHYQDDFAFYEGRPNLWIETLGDWGPGVVELVELPAADETFDNIVAYWRPAAPPQVGEPYHLSYRLHWGAEMPGRLPGPARVVATRIGRGGIPGRPGGEQDHKFVVDFAGGNLEMIERNAPVEVVVATEQGTIHETSALPVHGSATWRAKFDLRITGDGPVNLRCYLRLGDSALSETWLYTWSKT
ncbi:MAG: glucan biosynthesis protein [Pseudomonadota bacterium]|nr:glucan biosynthesis protein [Pseudomonadota bacterium]